MKKLLLPILFSLLIGNMNADMKVNSNTCWYNSKFSSAICTNLFSSNLIGFLAHPAQKIFPELVYADKDGTLSVDYISLIPVLAESIKEPNAKLEAPKKENNELKSEILYQKKEARS